jgi:hypothetical protein
VASDIEKAEAGSGPEPATAGRDWRDRLHPWALVELFVLCGLAIAQPLLDVTGQSPDFFLFRRADRLDIAALVVGVILLPALLLWGLEVTVGWSASGSGATCTWPRWPGSPACWPSRWPRS